MILDFPKAANRNVVDWRCIMWGDGIGNYDGKPIYGGVCIDSIAEFKVIDAGADYIQRNAFVTAKVIDTLNTMLQQNGSSDSLVVIGPSMGGLITRYALTFMEHNNINHNTRLWVSFDSPHNGANIPIGLQYAISIFSNYISDALFLRNEVLNNPSAKQMLVHHYLSNSESPSGAPIYNSNWQNTLTNIGFPQQPRRISISNGSINGTFIGTSGTEALSISGGSSFIAGYFKIFSTPSFNNRRKVLDASISLFF